MEDLDGGGLGMRTSVAVERRENDWWVVVTIDDMRSETGPYRKQAEADKIASDEKEKLGLP